MAKSDYIQEITEQRENWIQALWAHQVFPKRNLRTLDGNNIKVIFPGWLNRSSGPDFLDAHVWIGKTEYYGAVEIHLKSSGWYAHRHEHNPAFNAVVLHVVLECDTSRTIDREDGRSIPQLELQTLLNQKMMAVLGEADELLERYHTLPGRCGMKVSHWPASPLQRLVEHAAENRIQHKVNQLKAREEHTAPEELLFQLIFRTLGYSAYAYPFEELAQLYPFHTLIPSLREPPHKARTLIMSRWMGACGLLSQDPAQIKDPELREEFLHWQNTWNRVSPQLQVSEKLSTIYRPQNAPERRLLGMFHHLYRIGTDGLLKGWLNLLMNLKLLEHDQTLRQQARESMHTLFATPAGEIWQSHLSWTTRKSSKKSQLVGKDRQTIIWANAILPFFLNYSCAERLAPLEKLLYRLFVVLPAEQANQHTRFMEKRLFAFPNPGLPRKTLRTQQGLIQMHQDFCRSFDQGCSQCQILDFLDKFNQQYSEEGSNETL